MNIAIVGATGFVGKALVADTIARGLCVRAFGRSENPFSGSSVAPLVYCRIPAYRFTAESFAGCDALVVLAAKRPSADFSFADYASNVAIAEACFAAAADAGIRNIVFASSKAVFSDPQTLPWTEDTPTVPLSMYGASKAACEQIALLYNRKDARIKCLRLAQIIGTGERRGYLISTLLDNAKSKTTQVVFGSGAQRRQYIYIKDVLSAIFAALEKPDTAGIFHIGMRGSVSNLEMAICANEVFGNSGNLRHDMSRKMDAFSDEMDVTRAERILGWSAKYDLAAAFADIAGK